MPDADVPIPTHRLPILRTAALYVAIFGLPACVAVAGILAMPRLSHAPAIPYGENVELIDNEDARREHESIRRRKLEANDTTPYEGIPPDGQALFLRHCSNCHGVSGDGDGIAQLSVRARHFGFEKFKFVTTAKAGSTADPIPSDADLHALLQRGIPGSAMPAFPQLSEHEREAVIAHVRRLAVRGLYDRLYRENYDKLVKELEGDKPTAKDEVEIVAKTLKDVEVRGRAGPPLPIPDVAKLNGSAVRGKAIFGTAGCSKCHGEDGSGAGKQILDPQFDKAREKGTLAAPRNFILGQFKGGDADRDLYARIHLGIAGPFEMPSIPDQYATPQDTADLIAFIRSLAKPQ